MICSELKWSRSGDRKYFVQTSDTPTGTLPASISAGVSRDTMTSRCSKLRQASSSSIILMRGVRAAWRVVQRGCGVL